MDCQARQRVKRTEDDVVRNPNEQKPARPVASAKHEQSKEDREKPDDANPNKAIFKLTMCLEVGEVVCKSDGAGCYKQATDKGD